MRQEQLNQTSEQLRTPERRGFNFGQVRMMFAHADPELRLNQLSSQVVGDIKVDLDKTTWVSKTSRRDGEQKVTIGGQKLPDEIAKIFAWGVDTKEDEIVLKTAHEISHVFQNKKGLEQQLLLFLSGSNEINENAQEYIELYSALSGLGPVTGLPTMEIYHQQTESEKARVTQGLALDTRILEDITELIAAYSLGDEYFNFRLAGSDVSDEDKSTVARCVVAVYHKHIS